MKTNTTIDKRRRVRALEAKRDSLMATKTTTSTKLAVVRAELKHARKS